MRHWCIWKSCPAWNASGWPDNRESISFHFGSAGPSMSPTPPDVPPAFAAAQGYRFGYSSVSDAGLAQLAQLEGLVELSVSGTWLTNASLKYLSDFGELQTLDLSDTLVTDAGLEHLKDELDSGNSVSTAPRSAMRAWNTSED